MCRLSFYFVLCCTFPKSLITSQTSVLSWQVGNDFWFLCLLLFAFLSLNYRTAPTVPVRVKQLREMLRGCTHRYLMIPVLYFNSGWGLSWLSRGASLCWDELTCYPGAAVEVRERERECAIGRANPVCRMCCSRLLCLTGGCNSHREECKTLIGPPTLVQCFGQSCRLTSIIVVALYFLLRGRGKLWIKGCDLEKCPRLI